MTAHVRTATAPLEGAQCATLLGIPYDGPVPAGTVEHPSARREILSPEECR